MREIQIKNIMKYHSILTRMAILKKDNKKCWHGCEEIQPFIPCCVDWEYKTVQFLWEGVWQFLKMLDTDLSYNWANPFLDICPREVKTHVDTNTCTWIFTVVLFITTRKWKQPKCLSIDKRINKMWSIHIMEYYSALERSEVLIYATKRMIFENVLRERSQPWNITLDDCTYVKSSE